MILHILYTTSFMILVKNGLNITQKNATCKIALLFKMKSEWYCNIKIAFVSPYCKIPIVNSTFGPNHVQVNIEKKK